jgi:hypothetical protein
MLDVHATIAAALESRRAQREPIDRLYRAWCAMVECVDSLPTAIGDTSRQFAALGQQTDGLTDAGATEGNWHRDEIQALRQEITDLTPDIEAIRARFHRETVNIGVVGRPKAGKSTLLRTITGLGEEAIPSSEHNPTTAARSRILHRPDQENAEITLRTWDEFRDGYLTPLHRDAGCPDPVPDDPEEFLRYPYQRQLDASRSRSDDAGIDQQKFLKRLWTAQHSFDSYRKYLLQQHRGHKIDRLAALRPFVAYPQDDSSRERPYHAVRDVWIYCRFAVTDVANLALVDLPGAGEAALDVERQFLEDLKNEVDVLLQVKRPALAEAFIGEEDWRVLNLADAARMGVDRADFIGFVINSDPAHIEAAARENAERKAREEITGPNNIRLLIGDVASPDEVRENILGPVLDGLAQRLAAMDRQAAATQIKKASAVAERALAVIERLAAEVSRRARQIPNEEQALDRAAKRLRGTAGKQLDDLRKEYDRRAREHEPVPELNKAISRAAGDLNKWADDGFGLGSKQKWLTVIGEEMTVDPGETRDDQCTLARQKIRVEYGRIDSSLASAVDRLYEAVADVLRTHLTARLVPNERPLESLLATAQRLELETLCSALDDLLHFRDSYGSVFLRVGGPVVRQIRPVGGRVSGEHAAAGDEDGQADHQGGSLYSRAKKAASAAGTAHAAAAGAAHPAVGIAVVAAEVAAPIIAGWIWNSMYSDDSAAALHDALSKAFSEAVGQIEDLMRKEAGQLSGVLAASMSQFFDRFARTPDVEDEWAKLCAPIRRELWPKTFGGGAADLSAGLSRLGKAVAGSDAAARDFLAAAAGMGPSDAPR